MAAQATVRVVAKVRVACALVTMSSSMASGGRAQTKTAPPTAWMGGAARRVSAPLLGALLSSHAQKPPTNKAEGAAKEENVGAMHEREPKARTRRLSRCVVDK
jgi:predicted permease